LIYIAWPSRNIFAKIIFDVLRETDGEWEEEEKLESHSDWVRDVAWAPNIGLPTSKIASCSQVIVIVHYVNNLGFDSPLAYK
jgi:WD40 repeat protein